MPQPVPTAHHVGLVFVGGMIGAAARVALANRFPVSGGQFPWTTLVENLSGAFLLALVLTVMAGLTRASATVQLLVGTGALGSFTTYSTLAVELEALLSARLPSLAATYAVTSLIGGLGAAALGIWAGRAWTRPARTKLEKGRP